MSLDLPLPLENSIRGGSYVEASYICRSAGRHEAELSDDVGFRVVCLPRELTP